MSTIQIADKKWRKIYAFLKKHPDAYAGKQAKCRQFVEGVHWIMRTGAQWRELPEKYGKGNSVYKRFAGWEERGIWEAMFAHFSQEPDMESVLIDSTVIRAHMCASGGSKKMVDKASKPLAAVEADSVAKSTF